jgi:hypothetical protein
VWNRQKEAHEMFGSGVKQSRGRAVQVSNTYTYTCIQVSTRDSPLQYSNLAAPHDALALVERCPDPYLAKHRALHKTHKQ